MHTRADRACCLGLNALTSRIPDTHTTYTQAELVAKDDVASAASMTHAAELAKAHKLAHKKNADLAADLQSVTAALEQERGEVAAVQVR